MMEPPCSVLPSQRLLTSLDDQDDSLLSSSKQPLTWPVDNAQQQSHQCIRLLTSYSQGSPLTSRPPPSWPILVPPIVPTQSMWSLYNSTGHKLQVQQRQLQNGSIDGVNPIYLSPEFKEYRRRQAEKPDQKWPDLLEDAFLDAVLLIPQMGRKKFPMKNQLYGRNMLISEYLWIAYLYSLPAEAEPNPLEWRRGRKQVSSHMQVLKSFFIHHRFCHLFFGKEKDKNSNVRKHKKLKDDVKSESFNTNPVLIALSENRLPEVQLNYEYLGELLASDALVAVKPRRCRIYVSTKKVHTDLDQNISHDTEGIDNNSALPCRYNYNCLEDRSDREEKDLVIRQELLHEYTWNMTQRESISVRDLSRKWESNFPELNEAFKVAVQDSRCDILHMHVTLDMHAAGGIPDGSDLNGMVDVTITQPALQSHRWKVITRLVRPHELCGVAETMLCEITNDIDELFQHGLGCDDIRPYCSCMRSQNDQDIRRLPFPAQQWATIFDLSAQYPPYPKERGADRHHSTDAEAQRHRTKLTSNRPNYLSEYHGRKRPYGQDKYETGGPATLDGCLTQLDLIRQVGMLQEMWSRPRKVHDQQGWTRRAVIAWTFDQYHPNLDARHKTAMLSAGTEWCFVTALDSDSSEYQKQMFVTRKETVQSNPRLYECQLDKMKTEIFSSPSDISQSTKQKQNDLGTAETYRSRMDILSNYDLNDIGVVDSLLSGIASAPLTAPVPLSFDTSAIGISDQLAKDTHYLQARKSTMMSAMTFLNSNLKAFGANGSVSDVVDNTSWRAAPLHGGSHQAGSALDWNRDRAPEGPSWNLSSSDWNGALDLEADLLVPDWIMAASDHGTLWARAIAPTWQRMDAELSQWKKERCLDERTNAVEGGEFETQPTRTSQQVPDRQPLLDGNFDDVTYDIGLYN